MAVIPVVIYHVISFLCPGGYVGVDVFFVISGFLITKGIVGDLQRDEFSIRDFYVRRIRRIIPAYFLTILFVLAVFGFFVSYPNFIDISKAGLSSAFYSANIYFYLSTNYFDLPADKNPLLHLWSLGVEEQFYLIIPYALLLLWKCGARVFRAALLFAFLASLLAAVVAVRGGAANFAFFLLPCRAWELLAGSLIAVFPLRKDLGRVPASILGLVGLGLIAAACFGFSDTTPFPGAAALVPVAGAMLVILFGGNGPCRSVLESPLVVWVGKISYSLYLWHWPITLILSEINPPARVAWTVGLSLIAAYLSYRFVETPFRRPGVLDTKRAFALLAAGSLVIIAVCGLFPRVAVAISPEIMTRNSKGIGVWQGQPLWPELERTGESSETTCSLSELEADPSRVALRVGDPNADPSFLLWGDSHALALLAGTDKAASERGKSGIYINLKHSHTQQSEKRGKRYDPRPDRQPVLDWLERRPDLTDVILANRWLKRTRNEADIQETVDLCRRLRQMGKRVFVLTTVPEVDMAVLRRYSWGLPLAALGPSTPPEVYDRMAEWQDRMTGTVQAEKVASVVQIHRALMKEGFYHAMIRGECCYQDQNHLNIHGSIIAMEYAASKIWPVSDSRDTGGK